MISVSIVATLIYIIFRKKINFFADQRNIVGGELNKHLLQGMASAKDVKILDREEELDQILRDWCLPRDAAATTELLQAAGVPAHHVQNSPEVTSDPQLIHRNHFVEVPHEIYDTTWAEQYGFRLSKSDGTPTKSGPLWGEHNFEILSDLLGYEGDQIADLVIAGVLE